MPLGFSKDQEAALEAQKAANLAELHIKRAKVAVMDWVSEHRPDLEPYLRDAECSAIRKYNESGEVYVVNITVQGPQNRQYLFDFEVEFAGGLMDVRKM